MTILVKPVRLCNDTPLRLNFIVRVGMHSEVTGQEIVLQLNIEEVVTVRQLYPHIVGKDSVYQPRLLDEMRGDGAGHVNLFCRLCDRDCRWGHFVPHANQILIDHVAQWLHSDVQIVNWAWVIYVKICMDQLEYIRVLVWLNVRDQAASSVCFCQRDPLLIDITRLEQVCSDNILLVPDIDHDSNERRLLNDQVNRLLGSNVHQESVLSLEPLVANREVLRYLLMSAGPEFAHVPDVIKCLHNSHPVCLVHEIEGCESGQGTVMLVHGGNHVRVDTSEAIRREARRRLYFLLREA